MPIYLQIQAYGGGDTVDSGIAQLGESYLATPENVAASQVAAYLFISWDYEPVETDTLQSFKVYVGESDTPDWGTATPVDLSHGDGGSPVEGFSYNFPLPAWIGTTYVAVQAIGLSETLESDVFSLSIENVLVRLDGPAESAGLKHPTGLVASWLPSPVPVLTHHGFDVFLGKKAAQSLDFGSITAGATAGLTVTVTGAAVGDSVIVTPPDTIEAGLVWSGFVSAADTVTVRLANVTGSAIDPAAGAWRVVVVRH